MNRIWENILRTAIAGAERHPVSEADAQALGISSSAGVVETALRALPAAKLLQQAAAPIANRPEKLAEPCPPDERPFCSTPALVSLKTMLSNTAFSEAIPEFFMLLRRSGRRLPPQILPLILDWAARSRNLPADVEWALGPSGPWLARQHPDWSDLYSQTGSDWETGTFAQRLQVLKDHRQKSPLAGLALLEKTWAQERAEHRARFLEILRSGLSLADENLLEQTLNDKSRPVRFLAYRLLLLLPDSRLRQNLQALLKEHFQKNTAPEALFQLPDNSAREDGPWSNIRLLAIHPEPSTQPADSWFLLTPPEDLAQAAGLAPEAVLAAFFSQKKNLENEAAALLENIAWRSDPDWLRATGRYFFQNPEHEFWLSDALKSLLLALPEPDWQSLLAALAKHQQLLEPENSALVQALLVTDYPWPKLLVETLIYYPLRSEQPQNWMPPRHFRTLLERAAYRCSPELADHIHSSSDRQWPWAWQQALVQFRAVLGFRLAMQQALT